MVPTSLVLSVFILSAAAQWQGHGEIQSLNPAFFNAGFQGCISAPRTDINGSSLVIANCNNDDIAFQDWHLSFFDEESAGPQPITIFDDGSSMCIDVTGGVNADGTKLQIWTCTGGPNQQWISVSNFTLQWSGTDKCIDLTDGIADIGTVLQIWTCTVANSNQKWMGAPDPDEIQVANVIGGDSSAGGGGPYCITAASDTDGAEVVLAGCSDTTFPNGNITWTVPVAPLTNQLQTFSDKCLDVPNGSNVNGVKLQIWTCTPEPDLNQIFQNRNGQIEWSGTGKCLDLTNGLSTDGNPIQIWDCATADDNPNQVWFVNELSS